MEPLSIAASASALATFALRASKAIYTCVDEVRTADATLVQLKSEVDALQSGLESIASTFESDEVQHLYGGKFQNLSQSAKLLTSVKPLLTDCAVTLQKLEVLLSGIETKPGRAREIFRKPVKAVKINLRTRDIEFIRHQIRSYSSAMQMTLHMVAMQVDHMDSRTVTDKSRCLSVDGNKQVETLGEGLGEQLAALAVQITDVQTKVSEINEKGNDVDEETLVIAEPELNKQHVQHIEEYIASAKTILSNATVYNESISGTVVGNSDDVADMTGKFGSVLGLNDDQRNRVNQWLPGEPEKNESDSDDDDDDVDVSLFKARLAVAQKSLKAKDYKAAGAQFELCVANTAVMKKLPSHAIIDLKLDLASAYKGSGNNARQQAILQDLLQQDDVSKVQTLHLQHLLAVAYLDGVELDLAHAYAEQAMKGRRKLFGRRHESYHESLSLLANICEAQSNFEDANVYRHLLPEGYQKETASTLAAPSKDAATIKLLADNGYDINNRKTYYEALKWASDEKEQEIVRLLLKRGPELVQKDEDSGRMLWEAVRGGHEDMVQYLLDQGFNVDAAPRKLETALGHAAELGNESIARLLLDRGAKPNPPGDSRDVDTAYGGAALFRAAKNGHKSIVRLLLDRGALIDGKGHFGLSPLQIAAGCGHLAVVRLLLDRGANVNATSVTGTTALMDAAFNGRTEIVRLLLERGADADMKTVIWKDTAMRLAKQKNHDEVVKILKSYRTGLRKLW